MQSTKASHAEMMGAEMMMHEVQQRGEACSVVRWRSGLARVGTGLCSKFGSSKMYLTIEYSWIMHILMEGMVHGHAIQCESSEGHAEHYKSFILYHPLSGLVI